MRGSGTGESDDDDRRLELDGERLGIATHEVFEAEARAQQPDQTFSDDVPAEARQSGVGFDCGEEEAFTDTMGEALRGFQELVGLPMSGVMDEDTVKALDALYGDPS